MVRNMKNIRIVNEDDVLVHSCCAPCSTIAIERLKSDNYKPTLFYYNPNIAPYSEYKRRLDEVKRLCNLWNIQLFIPFETEREYISEHKVWRNLVKGHEFDKEGGERCHLCYRYRLRKSIEFAYKNGFKNVTTTLTTGPPKKASIINEYGKKLASKYNINFLEYDFKKKNGFLRSVQLSKELHIYRQNYCGCEFSLRDRILYEQRKKKQITFNKKN